MSSNKRKGLILSILGITSLILITAGVTYAFFNYAKEGTTENSITTGSITFIYEEVEAQGAGISIEDVFPISDEVGKAQSGSDKVFNFKVKSKTMNTASIPYTVTARMKANSTLDQSAVKMYLTEVSGENETQVLLNTYDKLNQTSINVPTGTVEKIIYTDTVPANSSNYEKNFRLRMWIPDTIDFSPVKDENGQDTYPYNGKKFTVTVNVYANAEVISVPSTPTYTSYNIGDAVTAIDGSKWHVLEASDENTETVTLLSDYNLNSDGSYIINCFGACGSMIFDSDGTNIYSENDANNIGYFIKNTYEPLILLALPGTTNVTLPTAEQISLADNKVFAQSSLDLFSNWLVDTNYWTKTVDTTAIDVSKVWVVLESFGSIDFKGMKSAPSNSIGLGYGARPVITTPKSNLLAE